MWAFSDTQLYGRLTSVNSVMKRLLKGLSLFLDVNDLEHVVTLLKLVYLLLGGDVAPADNRVAVLAVDLADRVVPADKVLLKQFALKYVADANDEIRLPRLTLVVRPNDFKVVAEWHAALLAQDDLFATAIVVLARNDSHGNRLDPDFAYSHSCPM